MLPQELNLLLIKSIFLQKSFNNMSKRYCKMLKLERINSKGCC